MLIADGWKDYELLDTGNGEKLERWGKYILRRPDPQVIWPRSQNKSEWDKADAVYHRSNSGGGSWEYKRKMPQNWKIKYNNLSFIIEPTGFKHTGLFPEQAVNWDWMREKIKGSEKVKVLNLFAYTGGATVACTEAGAEVCHVDAAKGMVTWAKNNLEASGLASKPARFLVDDCMKFIKREQRRESKYDAIIIDTTHVFDDVNILALEKSDTIIEVLTNDPANLKNTANTIKLFKESKVDNFFILLNEALMHDKNYYTTFDIKHIIGAHVDYIVSKGLYIKSNDKLVTEGIIPSLNKRLYSKHKKDWKKLEKMLLRILDSKKVGIK